MIHELLLRENVDVFFTSIRGNSGRWQVHGLNNREKENPEKDSRNQLNSLLRSSFSPMFRLRESDQLYPIQTYIQTVLHLSGDSMINFVCIYFPYRNNEKWKKILENLKETPKFERKETPNIKKSSQIVILSNLKKCWKQFFFFNLTI